MDGCNSSLEIETLADSNFHMWKLKTELVLTFRELIDHHKNLLEPSTSAGRSSWPKKDAKSKAIIGLSLSQ